MNSSFLSCSGNSAFFSDFLPAVICLHSEHGFLPSKVRCRAWVNEAVRRLSASIVVQATDCSTVQCAPVAASSATISRTWPNRVSTLGLCRARRVESSARCRRNFRRDELHESPKRRQLLG